MSIFDIERSYEETIALEEFFTDELKEADFELAVETFEQASKLLDSVQQPLALESYDEVSYQMAIHSYKQLTTQVGYKCPALESDFEMGAESGRIGGVVNKGKKVIEAIKAFIIKIYQAIETIVKKATYVLKNNAVLKKAHLLKIRKVLSAYKKALNDRSDDAMTKLKNFFAKQDDSLGRELTIKNAMNALLVGDYSESDGAANIKLVSLKEAQQLMMSFIENIETTVGFSTLVLSGTINKYAEGKPCDAKSLSYFLDQVQLVTKIKTKPTAKDSTIQKINGMNVITYATPTPYALSIVRKESDISDGDDRSYVEPATILKAGYFKYNEVLKSTNLVSMVPDMKEKFLNEYVENISKEDLTDMINGLDNFCFHALNSISFDIADLAGSIETLRKNFAKFKKEVVDNLDENAENAPFIRFIANTGLHSFDDLGKVNNQMHEMMTKYATHCSSYITLCAKKVSRRSKREYDTEER